MTTMTIDRPTVIDSENTTAVIRMVSKTAAQQEAIVDLSPNKLLVGKSFVVLPNGLDVEGVPSQDDWLEVCDLFARLHYSVHWVIGDWLNYGMETYRLTYDQAERLLRSRGMTFSQQTLRIDKYVASRVPLLWRHNKLSWQHHKEVASLDRDQHEHWLSLAEQKGLNTKELRAAIDGAEQLPWLCYTDLWSFKDPDPRFGGGHCAALPGQVIQNLLYYYTKPDAFVIGPTDRFGVLRDVCEKSPETRRECLSFDVAPVRREIMVADPTEAWPTTAQADLVFVALPDDGTVSESSPNKDSRALMNAIVANAVLRLKPRGILSVLVSPHFAKNQHKDLTWEVYSMLMRCKDNLTYTRRITVPETLQRVSVKTRQDVNEKHLMVSQIRDLLIFTKRNTSESRGAPSASRITRCCGCQIAIGSGYLESKAYRIGGRIVCSDCLRLLKRKGSLRLDDGSRLMSDGRIVACDAKNKMAAEQVS